MNRLLTSLAMIIILSVAAKAQISNVNITDLDRYISNAQAQWQVPGMSVTIVKDGKVLLSKGYGVRSLLKADMVDEETLFMLGSTTKAMTAAAMAMLIDEDKLTWSDKVIDHLPWFRLSDPHVTRELTIKDLFTHNSGLGNTDLLWVLWDYSTEEIVQRLAQWPLSYSMRGGYTYQNIMYATAGLVIEKVSGQPWDAFIHDRIFAPLGMGRSCALRSCAQGYINRARPHYLLGDEMIQIIDSNADSIGSAGSAWSCSSDIAKWIQFVLDEGVVDGQRLLSEENFKILHSPQIIIPERQFYPSAALTEPHFTAYSLGWFLHDYQGEYVQFHTGSLNGSGAIIGLMPDHNLGVYVMVNRENAEVRHAIMYKVFDYILGLGDRDWSTDLKEIYDDRDAWRDQRRSDLVASRVSDAPANLSKNEMIGTYEHKSLGVLEIVYKDDRYVINCRPDRHIALSHWHYNTYMGKILEYTHEQGDLIDFDRGANGGISFNLYGYVFKKLKK